MTVLILYGTNSGGTRVAAELVHDVLSEAGHTVTIKRANDIDLTTLRTFNLVVLASCSWERFEGKQRLEGQLQEHMFELTEKLKSENFKGQKFAVFGLGDSSYTHFAGSVDHLLEFVNAVHGELIGQALRIDGFFFRQQENELILTKWAKNLAQVS